MENLMITSEELISHWRNKQEILEGKVALGIKLSPKEKSDLAFYRAFLTVAMDRRERKAA
jgi:hypothetical protein